MHRSRYGCPEGLGSPISRYQECVLARRDQGGHIHESAPWIPEGGRGREGVEAEVMFVWVEASGIRVVGGTGKCVLRDGLHAFAD
jgi:hypothetical protein